ncbi:YggT family protein [Streptococcus infantis]|uniref:YggT family protein n=1 Tax=Streptococcus infantis TaxID=68892 RepID=UPI00050F2A60|nr:membrane protein [Peptoniphilus lacrimalis DNF00528]
MFLIIRFIQNATDIYSLILVAFALLSWFPNAYNTQLGKLLEALCKPILEPLKRLPLQIAGLDFSVWIALILLRMISRYLINLLVVL